MFIKDKARLRAEWAALSEELRFLSSCLLSLMSTNSVLDELRVSRLAKPLFLCILTIRLNVGDFQRACTPGNVLKDESPMPGWQESVKSGDESQPGLAVFRLFDQTGLHKFRGHTF